MAYAFSAYQESALLPFLITISHALRHHAGILGLAGAPTFQRGQNVITLITTDHRKVEAEYEAYKVKKKIEEKR
jgi:hypothetical protein